MLGSMCRGMGENRYCAWVKTGPNFIVMWRTYKQTVNIEKLCLLRRQPFNCKRGSREAEEWMGKGIEK